MQNVSLKCIKKYLQLEWYYFGHTELNKMLFKLFPVSFYLFYNMATRKAKATYVPIGSPETSWSRLTQRPQSLCPWIRARPFALLHSHGCSLWWHRQGKTRPGDRSWTRHPPLSGVKGLGVTAVAARSSGERAQCPWDGGGSGWSGWRPSGVGAVIWGHTLLWEDLVNQWGRERTPVTRQRPGFCHQDSLWQLGHKE